MKKLSCKQHLLALTALVCGISVPVALTAKGCFDQAEASLNASCQTLSKAPTCKTPHPITQADINNAFTSCTPFTISEEGYWFLAEDISFDVGNFPSSCTNVANSFIGTAAINIAAPNVELDFCNHTLTINGFLVTGVAVFSTQNGVQLGTSVTGAARAYIHGGTIQGLTGSTSTLAGANGIFIYTNGVHVSDMLILNVLGTEVIEPSFFVPVSTGIAIQTANVANASATDVFYNPAGGILIENCNLVGNGTGIGAENWNDNLIVRNSSIERGSTYPASVTPPTTTLTNGTHHGILFTAGFGQAPNILIENVGIANMGINGINTSNTPLANYILRNVHVGDSGANGILIAGFQNLLISNCQALNSGYHGISVSLNRSQNVLIENTQIAGAGTEALRIDNVENLKIEDVQVSNYVLSFYNPCVTANGAYPVVKIQDVRNGLVNKLQVVSGNGISEGVEVNKCSGLTFDNCNVQVNASTTPTSTVPNLDNCPVQVNRSTTPMSTDSKPAAFNFAGGNSNVTLKNSTIAGVPHDGIRVGPDPLQLFPNSYGVVLSGNTIENAERNGISIVGTDTAGFAVSTIIDGNKVLGSGEYGIVDGGKNTYVYNNFAVDNRKCDYSWYGVGTPLKAFSYKDNIDSGLDFGLYANIKS